MEDSKHSEAVRAFMNTYLNHHESGHSSSLLDYEAISAGISAATAAAEAKMLPLVKACDILVRYDFAQDGGWNVYLETAARTIRKALAPFTNKDGE